MPALAFVIWDLTPFIPLMHNWRRNIIFIECDRIAIDSLVDVIAGEYPSYEIYAGIKKPVLRIRLIEKEASIVIVAREAKHRREVEGDHPKLEKCLVDMLYYAKAEILPLDLKDVLDLWEHYLIGNKIRFNELYRYSLRRYLGWFVSILAYELSRRKEHIEIDRRHYAAGLKNVELVKMVA